MAKALYGLTLVELQEIALSVGLKKFAGAQIADWLYSKNVESIDGMTNLSLKAREALKEGYEVGRIAPAEVLTSKDGTRKMLYRYGREGGKEIAVETAYIPDGYGERNTLCVSSQAGCKMSCEFCMTGRQGFGGNLTAGEILNQMASTEGHEDLTNIVYMGMGEPMDNLVEVLKSIEIMTSKWGYAWSPRRITVSTIGIPERVKTFLDSCEAHIAISLHSPRSEERVNIMPVEKAYPIEETIDLLRGYDWEGQRRLTFEYTMFDGVNDSRSHADALLALVKGLHCRVNLIGFNAIPDSRLKGTSLRKMAEFRDYLCNKGLTATIRQSKGSDIEAACGMLSTKRKQVEGQ
jgi:23S rRNA (adenine2503-C2)-methyltransferase